MKEKLKNSPVLQKWFYTQSPLVITRPALRETAVSLLYLLCGFLLSCGEIAGSPSPFALAFLATAGGGLRGLCCLLGTALGYLAMHPLAQGLQMSSTGILIYVCSYIFGTLWITKRSWFRCLVAGAMTGGVGLIFLLSQRITPELVVGYGLLLGLAALMPLSYEQLFAQRWQSAGTLLAISSFLVGAAAIPLPFGMNLGVVAAVALVGTSARRTDLYMTVAMAAACGLGLDVAMMTGGVYTLVLCCGGMLGTLMARRHWPLRVLLFALAFVACGAYAGESGSMLLWTAAVGTAVSLLLPAGLMAGREEGAAVLSAQLVEQQLSSGNTALRRLYDAIGLDPQDQAEQEKNHIFDRAAAKVCRRCSRYNQCWDTEAGQTYQQLSPVLRSVQERGQARREDFPEPFAKECRQLEGLLVAINQEADSLTSRRRSRNRSQENRMIVSRTLLHVSRMLEQNARQLRVSRPMPTEGYRARLGVYAKGRFGTKLSGDRGVSLHTEDGHLYVILCDGAGTGELAAKESLLAVDTLAELITAGMPPENAMELISGMYILRETGGFSTMDVLKVSLISGQGTLYKWGAAPSYLRSGENIKRLGSAAPPPGISMGNDCGAEILPLNLWDGDTLVLVSDGVAGEAAEELLRQFSGENVKVLAKNLVERAVETGGEDDMTAAVIRIEEVRL